MTNKKRRTIRKTRKKRVKRYPRDSFKSGPGQIHQLAMNLRG